MAPHTHTKDPHWSPLEGFNEISPLSKIRVNKGKRIRHSSCFSYMNSAIVDKGKFLFINIFQLTEEEGKTEVEEYHHFILKAL